MGKKEKLIARLKTRPKNFEFTEAKTLLSKCGYTQTKVGKTGGSKVKFIKGDKIFRMHKPHPRKELLAYQVDELIDELTQEGLM